MLPKPEKTKKTPKSEQLDLVETISTVDKVKNKRRFVIIALIITIGLSVIFSLYRWIKNFHFNPPRANISTPAFIPSTSLDSDITKLISKDTGYWSYYVSSNDFNLTKNPDQLFSDINQKDLLDNLNQSPFGDVNLSLPEGLKIKKYDSSKDGFYRVGYQIVAPTKSINIILKVSGSSLEVSKQLIPQLVSAIYWRLI